MNHGNLLSAISAAFGVAPHIQHAMTVLFPAQPKTNTHGLVE